MESGGSRCYHMILLLQGNFWKVIWEVKPAVPNLFGTRDWFLPGVGWGMMVQAVMWAVGSDGEAGEALLTCLPLTSCCAARFLTGLGLVLVHSPGVGEAWVKQRKGLCFVLLCFVLLIGKSSIIIGCQHHNALLSLKGNFNWKLFHLSSQVR